MTDKDTPTPQPRDGDTGSTTPATPADQANGDLRPDATGAATFDERAAARLSHRGPPGLTVR